MARSCRGFHFSSFVFTYFHLVLGSTIYFKRTGVFVAVRWIFNIAIVKYFFRWYFCIYRTKWTHSSVYVFLLFFGYIFLSCCVHLWLYKDVSKWQLELMIYLDIDLLFSFTTQFFIRWFYIHLFASLFCVLIS